MPLKSKRVAQRSKATCALFDEATGINHDEMPEIAREALAQLSEPLVDFALDSGLSARDLYATFREAAVRTVASRQLKSGQRVNISGIAASTGIPRGEVSRVLNQRQSVEQPKERREQSINRVLKQWHQNSEFRTIDGKPAELKIYGSGATFETLVKRYGRGIPTRATLEELARSGAVEVTSSQLVRALNSVAVDRGLTPRTVQLFGDRATELFSMMLRKARDPQSLNDMVSVSRTIKSTAQSSLFRNELSREIARFLSAIGDSLHREIKQESVKDRRVRARRVTVTMVYYETRTESHRQKVALKRQNLRRKN